MSLPIEDATAVPIAKTQGTVSVEQKIHFGLTIELGSVEQEMLSSRQDLTTNVQTKDGYITVTIRHKSA